MIIHTAHLTCKAEHIDAFNQRLRQHAKITRARETGCHRFDVHQNTNDPRLFFLHEVYEDQAALTLHQSLEHFHAFRADTKEWVIERHWWFWTLDTENY